MIPAIRQRYNAAFTEARYMAFMAELNKSMYWPVDFRVAESPLFLDADTTQALVAASNDIVSQLAKPAFRAHAETAIPAGLEVPKETEWPHFLAVDFALCRDASGKVLPQLIELQGFPEISRRVAAASGRPLHWQKSVVGEGAFTHEAGIHVDGLLKDPANYQGFDPRLVGRRHRLVLGEHSGPRAVQRVMAELRAMGFEPSPQISGGGSDVNIFSQRKLQMANVSVGYREIHSTGEHIAVADLEHAADLVQRLLALPAA